MAIVLAIQVQTWSTADGGNLKKSATGLFHGAIHFHDKSPPKK
jgi:hypothetical protein